MSESDHILELYRGTILLAILSRIEGWDFPWYQCDFQPMPEFEQYRALFDEELRLLESDSGTDEHWLLAYEKIEALELTLIDPDQGKAAEVFLLHVEGQRARFKVVFNNKDD